MHKKELGSKGASKKDVEGLSEEILYKIDIPANRYDMLCLEGIARALNIFNGRIPRVDYRLANMAGDLSHILSTHEQSSGNSQPPLPMQTSCMHLTGCPNSVNVCSYCVHT